MLLRGVDIDMTRPTLMICDDETEARTGWAEILRATPSVATRFDVRVLPDEAINDEVVVLEARRKAARETQTFRGGVAAVDDADVLVVDYDLLYLDATSFLTGENLAYLARCYSTCGFILALNQFSGAMFDLTLKGHPHSFADLNILAEALSHPGLWEDRAPGFRPWSWPLVPDATASFERRVAFLLAGDNLDRPIVGTLGIPESVVAVMDRELTESITGFASSLEELTFREFVCSSGNGLRGKDEVVNASSQARIAAARVAQWLEAVVLPGQDILVDAPHLVSRFPSLLEGNPDDVEAWNRTCRLDRGAERLGVKTSLIQSFRAPLDEWVSRPTWFWPLLSEEAELPEVEDPWKRPEPPYVFCEDTSRFAPVDAVVEFVADLPSPFSRRYVLDRSSVQGQEWERERRRVEGQDHDQLPTDISYAPRVRYAL